MKISAVYILFFLPFALTQANAQQNGLAPDQNPRYKESQERYIKQTDSLSNTEGITLQQTYKAYDWYEARLERRQQNREWRHQQNFNRSYFNRDLCSVYYYPYFRQNSSFRGRPSWHYHH